MFECELRIEGIDDDKINGTFSKVMSIFTKQGYSFESKIKFLGNGRIKIIGFGKDGRCAFCEYFRQAILDHYSQNKMKGSIDLINCPYNPNKRIDYSPEATEAKEKLKQLYLNLKKKS
jgi:hypothetical protein